MKPTPKALQRLHPSQVEILELRRKGFSLAAIGNMKGFSRERIRQKEAVAMRWLRWYELREQMPRRVNPVQARKLTEVSPPMAKWAYSVALRSGETLFDLMMREQSEIPGVKCRNEIRALRAELGIPL